MSALDERLYRGYASTHAGVGDAGSAAVVYRRDIRPHLPSGATVLDLGCGQGDLVQLLDADGFTAHGVDISAEQVRLAHGKGLSRVRLGDIHDVLNSSDGAWDVIVATDFLEHLDKAEALRTFDEVLRALRPGGLFLARVPNAVSPTGGHIMFADLTHRTWYTQRSIRQLAAVAGFSAVRTFACPPVAHGGPSLARALLWKPISGLLKLTLAVETGQVRGHIVTHNLMFAARRDAGRP
jgi:SAM-dependent methyltransferase